MAVNIGSANRLIWIIPNLALIILPFVLSWGLLVDPLARIGLPIIGAVLAVTALVRFCPLYRLIGIRTCKVQTKWKQGLRR